MPGARPLAPYERRTQREVADVAGVTELTLFNRYKELAEKLDIDIIL